MHSAFGSGHVVAGRYRLLDQVGRGAMGIVWRGRDDLLDREVAIKQIVLTPSASATQAQSSYERTLREARTAARLSHPGVVTVFDVVEEDGSPWIVMEFVRARPLDQVIAEDGPLPPARAAQLGLGLLEALTSAHQAGVLHRDVKPSNVLISPDGKAVLTDFGIATIQGDPGLTQAGMVVGTPGFSPPERVRGAPATTASDLWSLGATLYAAVEGRGPFDRAGGSSAIIASIATEPAPRAPSAGPLAPVIEALLKADPAERPDAATTARLLTQAWKAARTPGRFGLQASRSLIDLTTATRSAGIGLASPAGSPAGQGSEATTATQVVGVPSDVMPTEGKQSEPMPASAQAAGSGELIGTALAAAPAAAAVGVVPDLMATPNFADLKMPTGTAPPESELDTDHAEEAAALAIGALRTDPIVAGGSTANSSSMGASSTGSSGTDRGTAAPATLPAKPAGPVGDDHESRASEFLRKRGVVALAPVAALAIAAAIVYAALPAVRNPINRLVVGGNQVRSGPAAAGRVHHGTRGGTGSHGNRSGGQSGSGNSGTSGKPAPGGPSTSGKPNPSGKPSTRGRPSASGKPSSSGHPSASPSSTNPSPSPDPSPTPSQTSPASGGPPPGYVWDKVTAASVGTIAGFRIAGPAGWVMTPGLNTVIKPTSGATRLDINMSPWTYAAPVSQAKHLQVTARSNHRLYQLKSIVATRFRGWPAARWTFSWQAANALYPTDVTELLFTAQTIDGPQQYVMWISAPSQHESSALAKFNVAKQTFKALPY